MLYEYFIFISDGTKYYNISRFITISQLGNQDYTIILSKIIQNLDILIFLRFTRILFLSLTGQNITIYLGLL